VKDNKSLMRQNMGSSQKELLRRTLQKTMAESNSWQSEASKNSQEKSIPQRGWATSV